MKFRPVLVALVLTFGLVACGGDDGDGGIDAAGIDAPSIDAPPNIDAAPAMGIGQACTGTGQADCPVGFECLTLTGGTGSWCSKTCTTGAGDMCMQGYSGPGIAACILQVTPQGGGNPQTFCGVVCADQPGDANDYCPGCNGTCPGTLQCSAPLMNQQGMTLATGCV